MTDIRHVGIDPGITTGWAATDDTGRIVDMGQVTYTEVLKFLDSLGTNIKHLVVEDFAIMPNVNFAFDTMKVIRVIGAIQMRAFQLGLEVKLQSPTVKYAGYKWAGIEVPKDHSMSHQTDAYAHVVYYNHKILNLPIPVVRRAREERDKKG